MTDEPLLEVFEVLGRLRVPYMLTGSYASNLYGKIRSTFDADLVVAIQPQTMKGLVDALERDYYEDYDQTAFARSRSQQLFGKTIAVIAPEDLILAKLRWAKAGGSGRQIEDAQGVYQLQKDRMDLSYLRHWAPRLSVAALLERLEA